MHPKEYIQALKHKTLITTINIAEEGIAFQDLVALGELIKHNTTITSINASDNYIGDEGAMVIALALQGNMTLIKLNCSNNYITDKGVSAIVAALSNNHVITEIHFNNTLTPLASALCMRNDYLRNKTIKMLLHIDDADTQMPILPFLYTALLSRYKPNIIEIITDHLFSLSSITKTNKIYDLPDDVMGLIGKFIPLYSFASTISNSPLIIEDITPFYYDDVSTIGSAIDL